MLSNKSINEKEKRMKKINFFKAKKCEKKLFNDLHPYEEKLYKRTFHMLRKPYRLWLAAALLNYRHYGILPKVVNHTLYMQDIFMDLVDHYKQLQLQLNESN